MSPRAKTKQTVLLALTTAQLQFLLDALESHRWLHRGDFEGPHAHDDLDPLLTRGIARLAEHGK